MPTDHCAGDGKGACRKDAARSPSGGPAHFAVGNAAASLSRATADTGSVVVACVHAISVRLLTSDIARPCGLTHNLQGGQKKDIVRVMDSQASFLARLRCPRRDSLACCTPAEPRGRRSQEVQLPQVAPLSNSLTSSRHRRPADCRRSRPRRRPKLPCAAETPRRSRPLGPALHSDGDRPPSVCGRPPHGPCLPRFAALARRT